MYQGKEYNECTTEGYGNKYWCGHQYEVGFNHGWGMCSGPCKSPPGIEKEILLGGL